MRAIYGLMLGGLVAAVVVAVFPSGGGAIAADADGKAAFLAAKCEMCHAVPAAGIEAKAKIEKMKGPDLSADSVAGDADQLAAFLRREVDVDGTKHKKAFKGTDEELATIVAWLSTLKAE